jgi:CBS domain-containing protein
MGLNDTVRAVLDHKGIGVCAVAPETPVYEALEIMADKDIGALLVMAESELQGVFSERDYARKVILHGKSSKDTPVGEIISRPPIVAGLDQSVDDCLRLMTDFRVRHLPVVDQEAVIGVLSIGDLVNWIIRRQEEEIHHLQHYISGAYPA